MEMCDNASLRRWCGILAVGGIQHEMALKSGESGGRRRSALWQDEKEAQLEKRTTDRRVFCVAKIEC